MKIIDCKQGTAEWLESRRCMVTGSKMDRVMGSSLDQLMLVCELIAEEATEQIKAFKSTPEMDRGTAEEVFARKHYENVKKAKVTQLGFCISDEFEYLGVSGDGWIENKGIYSGAIEIKSPDTKNAVFYKLASSLSPTVLGLGSWSKPTKTEPEPIWKDSSKAPFCGIPIDYKWQVITYFVVNTDLLWLDFNVYDPRFIDDASKLHIVRITRDDPRVQEAIEEVRKELVLFREFWMKCREKIINDNF